MQLLSTFVGATLSLAALVATSDLERDTQSELESALAEIQASRIRADVEFFADDEMRGRDTPSAELSIAAGFVRARLERLGFTPGAGDSFYHEFDVVHRRVDLEASRVVVSAKGEHVPLEFGEDYLFYSDRHFVDLALSGEVVFGGDGSKSELKQIDAEGRWVLCVDGETSNLRRARNIERVGAAGLLCLPDPSDRTGEDPFVKKLERTTEAARNGRVALPSKRDSDPPLPSLFFSRSGASKLLGLCSYSPDGDSKLPKLGESLGINVTERRVATGLVAVPNVCGLWPGSDPELARELIIVSAHYDHVGVEGDEIYNGADDNASGSMGMLALAEALAARGPLRRSVLLMWVSGEEKGLWGSAAWAKDPVLGEGVVPICDINIDMIGRNAPGELYLTPSREHEEFNGLARIAHELAPLEGFAELGSADQYWARSDHMNFAVHLEIPVAFFFAGEHRDYHQPSDTSEKLDYDKIRRVTRLVMRMIDAMQSDELDLLLQ